VNLEYFISSLPMLMEDLPAKLSPEAFVELCREQLDPALAAAAGEMLGVGAPDATGAAASPHPFVLEWRDREAQLRNAVAAERARRLNAARPAPRETHGCDAAISTGVAAAFAVQDPLARERAFDALRWRALDEMQGVAPFTEAVVLAYAGKLALNARRFSIDADKGMDKFKELTKR